MSEWILMTLNVVKNSYIEHTIMYDKRKNIYKFDFMKIRLCISWHYQENDNLNSETKYLQVTYLMI